FKEVCAIRTEDYTVHVEALNGTFYKGYNEIRLTVVDDHTHENAGASAATLLPLRSDPDGSKSAGPHRYDLIQEPDVSYFSGYAVFTEESSVQDSWELYISFTVADQIYKVQQSVSVRKQPNTNRGMTMFTGNDGRQYCIALVSPQSPKPG